MDAPPADSRLDVLVETEEGMTVSLITVVCNDVRLGADSRSAPPSTWSMWRPALRAPAAGDGIRILRPGVFMWGTS